MIRSSPVDIYVICMSQETRAVLKRRMIARRLLRVLRRRLGSNLLAAGLCGSVSRGTADKYSDIDMFVILRKLADDWPRVQIVDGIYCGIDSYTPRSALSKISEPSPDLPEILGGFTNLMPLYDRRGILRRLQSRAKAVPPEVFRRSAELALLGSYEDFCRAKSAYSRRDDVVFRDNVYLVTYSAALIVASLNQAAFASDREIFKAHKTFSRLPRHYERIEKLRYGSLKRRELFRVFLDFYLNLVEFCEREGISLPVSRRVLKAARA